MPNRILGPLCTFILVIWCLFQVQRSAAQTNVLTNASPNASALGATNSLPPTPEIEGVGSGIARFLSRIFRDDGILDAVAKLLALLFGLLVAYLATKVHKLKQWISGPRFPMPAARTDRTNRVLMVAIGGTGKTTTIKNMMHNLGADPRVKTGDVVTY